MECVHDHKILFVNQLRYLAFNTFKFLNGLSCISNHVQEVVRSTFSEVEACYGKVLFIMPVLKVKVTSILGIFQVYSYILHVALSRFHTFLHVELYCLQPLVTYRALSVSSYTPIYRGTENIKNHLQSISARLFRNLSTVTLSLSQRNESLFSNFQPVFTLK